MTSKQSQLRQMMKAEREKNKIFLNTSANDDTNTTRSGSGSSSKVVKGILKTKSSYSREIQQGNNNDDMKKQKNTIAKEKVVALNPNHSFKDEYVHNSSHFKSDQDIIVNTKDTFIDSRQHTQAVSTSATKENSNNDVDDDNVMKEFEDFLNSVDEDVDEADNNVDENNKSNKIETQVIDNSEILAAQDAVDENVSIVLDVKQQRNKEEEELEQTVYEARLAKLMLLSRKRKSDAESDNVVIDYSPQLAFQENSFVVSKSENGSKQSIKNMLKEKRQKSSKSCLGSLSKEQVNLEEDSYWS